MDNSGEFSARKQKLFLLGFSSCYVVICRKGSPQIVCGPFAIPDKNVVLIDFVQRSLYASSLIVGICFERILFLEVGFE